MNPYTQQYENERDSLLEHLPPQHPLIGYITSTGENRLRVIAEPNTIFGRLCEPGSRLPPVSLSSLLNSVSRERFETANSSRRPIVRRRRESSEDEEQIDVPLYKWTYNSLMHGIAGETGDAVIDHLLARLQYYCSSSAYSGVDYPLGDESLYPEFRKLLPQARTFAVINVEQVLIKGKSAFVPVAYVPYLAKGEAWGVERICFKPKAHILNGKVDFKEDILYRHLLYLNPPNYRFIDRLLRNLVCVDYNIGPSAPKEGEKPLALQTRGIWVVRSGGELITCKLPVSAETHHPLTDESGSKQECLPSLCNDGEDVEATSTLSDLSEALTNAQSLCDERYQQLVTGLNKLHLKLELPISEILTELRHALSLLPEDLPITQLFDLESEEATQVSDTQDLESSAHWWFGLLSESDVRDIMTMLEKEEFYEGNYKTIRANLVKSYRKLIQTSAKYFIKDTSSVDTDTNQLLSITKEFLMWNILYSICDANYIWKRKFARAQRRAAREGNKLTPNKAGYVSEDVQNPEIAGGVATRLREVWLDSMVIRKLYGYKTLSIEELIPQVRAKFTENGLFPGEDDVGAEVLTRINIVATQLLQNYFQPYLQENGGKFTESEVNQKICEILNSHEFQRYTYVTAIGALRGVDLYDRAVRNLDGVRTVLNSCKTNTGLIDYNRLIYTHEGQAYTDSRRLINLQDPLARFISAMSWYLLASSHLEGDIQTFEEFDVELESIEQRVNDLFRQLRESFVMQPYFKYLPDKPNLREMITFDDLLQALLVIPAGKPVRAEKKMDGNVKRKRGRRSS